MRLREGEVQAIKKSFQAVFGDGAVYLFGSIQTADRKIPGI